MTQAKAVLFCCHMLLYLNATSGVYYPLMSLIVYPSCRLLLSFQALISDSCSSQLCLTVCSVFALVIYRWSSLSFLLLPLDKGRKGITGSLPASESCPDQRLEYAVK